jgi:hypothetical protein
LNATSSTGSEGSNEQLDLLSLQEEGSLASVRHIVEEMRSKGDQLQVDAVCDALKSLGALAIPGLVGIGGTVFDLNGTRFQIRPTLGPRGAVEICFLCKSP